MDALEAALEPGTETPASGAGADPKYRPPSRLTCWAVAASIVLGVVALTGAASCILVVALTAVLVAAADAAAGLILCVPFAAVAAGSFVAADASGN